MQVHWEPSLEIPGPARAPPRRVRDECAPVSHPSSTVRDSRAPCSSAAGLGQRLPLPPDTLPLAVCATRLPPQQPNGFIGLKPPVEDDYRTERPWADPACESDDRGRGDVASAEVPGFCPALTRAAGRAGAAGRGAIASLGGSATSFSDVACGRGQVKLSARPGAGGKGSPFTSTLAAIGSGSWASDPRLPSNAPVSGVPPVSGTTGPAT